MCMARNQKASVTKRVLNPLIKKAIPLFNFHRALVSLVPLHKFVFSVLSVAGRLLLLLPYSLPFSFSLFLFSFFLFISRVRFAVHPISLLSMCHGTFFPAFGSTSQRPPSQHGNGSSIFHLMERSWSIVF